MSREYFLVAVVPRQFSFTQLGSIYLKENFCEYTMNYSVSLVEWKTKTDSVERAAKFIDSRKSCWSNCEFFRSSASLLKLFVSEDLLHVWVAQ